MSRYERRLGHITDRITGEKEWETPRDLPELAMKLGRRVISAYSRRFSEQRSVLSHGQFVKSLDALTRGEAERRAALQAEYYPEYQDFLCNEGEAQEPQQLEMEYRYE